MHEQGDSQHQDKIMSDWILTNECDKRTYGSLKDNHKYPMYNAVGSTFLNQWESLFFD